MKTLALLVTLLVGLSGCATEPAAPDPTDQQVLVGKDTVGTLELALYLETEPHVGLNPVSVKVTQTPTGSAVTNVMFRIDPTMPSMGHGSPGNVHPVHHDNGWYRGTCNFTMTGDWDIALIRMDHDTVMHTVHFPVVVR